MSARKVSEFCFVDLLEKEVNIEKKSSITHHHLRELGIPGTTVVL